MSASQFSEAPRSLVALLGDLLVLRLYYSLQSSRSGSRADRQREVSIVRPAQERGVSQGISLRGLAREEAALTSSDRSWS